MLPEITEPVGIEPGLNPGVSEPGVSTLLTGAPVRPGGPNLKLVVPVFLIPHFPDTIDFRFLR